MVCGGPWYAPSSRSRSRWALPAASGTEPMNQTAGYATGLTVTDSTTIRSLGECMNKVRRCVFAQVPNHFAKGNTVRLGPLMVAWNETLLKRSKPGQKGTRCAFEDALAPPQAS